MLSGESIRNSVRLHENIFPLQTWRYKHGEQITFEATGPAEAGEYLAAMQAENGKCFSAEKVSKDEVAYE